MSEPGATLPATTSGAGAGQGVAPSSTQNAIDNDLLGGDLAVASAYAFVLDGVPIGLFREVSGLKVEIDVVTYEEGGQNAFVHKLPGRMKWENIKFKRGLTNSDKLFEWFWQASGEGFAQKGDKVQRLTGSIQALNSEGKTVRSWDIIGAMPVRWTGPDFGSSKNTEALEEELEIAHHGFKPTTHDATKQP